MKKKSNKISKSSSSVSIIDTGKHTCKNCNTEGEGQFCSFCGQRYHAHKESFGELVYEFVSDFLHFDSRFFRTVLPLLLSPGTLTKEYNAGKQRSQFHPIRLYLFSSFVYFFLFFAFNDAGNNLETADTKNHVLTSAESIQTASKEDSLNLPPQENPVLKQKSQTLFSGTTEKPDHNKKNFVTLHDSTAKYNLTINAYLDSLLTKNVTPEEYKKNQKALPKAKRDGYFERIVAIRLLKINLQGEEGKKEFFRKIIETFLHNIPKMLFFLLPVFAFLLKLLYFRKKEFYYVDHAILSLHYFSLIFLMLILSNYILDAIFRTTLFTTLASVWISIYLLLAMKKLYGQSWKKTLLKYITLGILFLITVIFTLLINMAFSALMV